MNSRLKKFGQGILVLLLASSFIGLGVWQLHRAQDMQSSSKVATDSHIYPLIEIATANGSIPPSSIGEGQRASASYQSVVLENG